MNYDRRWTWNIVDNMIEGRLGGEVAARLLDLWVECLRVHAMAVVKLNGNAVRLGGKPARGHLVADAPVANGSALEVGAPALVQGVHNLGNVDAGIAVARGTKRTRRKEKGEEKTRDGHEFGTLYE